MELLTDTKTFIIPPVKSVRETVKFNSAHFILVIAWLKDFPMKIHNHSIKIKDTVIEVDMGCASPDEKFRQLKCQKWIRYSSKGGLSYAKRQKDLVDAINSDKRGIIMIGW